MKRIKNIGKAEPYLWLLPAIILFTVFTFYPFLETIYKSFFIIDTRGNIKEFVGLENYQKILSDESFCTAVKNTLIFVLLTVPTSKVLGFILAMLANKRRKLSAFYETAFTLPMAVASSVIAMIFQLLYVPTLGLLNTALGTNIQWLKDPHIALISIAVVQIWLSTGYAFIFLLAAVRNVPEDIVESADLEGASILQKIRKIYLPLTAPTIFYLVCSDIAFMMMMMGLVNIMTKGGPNNATMTIIYYVYRQFAGSGNYTMANPAAVIAFAMTFVITMTSFIFQKKGGQN